MLGADGGAEGLLQKSTRMSTNADIMSMGATLESTLDDDNTKEVANTNGAAFKMVDMTLMEELDPESEGMMPRTISSLFGLMKKIKASTEFTIRVSYVEIYLEKILDLLHPQGTTASITIEEDEEADKAAGPSIKGASELCCFDEADVCALLSRGNACRTMSSTEMNTESSRSHAIFVLRLEQRDRLTGKAKTSVLHMVDLAGSELGSKEASKRSSMANVSAVQTEALMINKSLSALNKMIRAQLAHQGGEKNIPLDDISRQSKLSRLLRPSFGGNCLTTLLLTASPSSYNIGETIATINFGQRCRRIYNDPHRNVEEETPQYLRNQVKESKSQYEDAMALVRALAGECLRMKDGESLGTGPLWDTVAHLGKKTDAPVDFKVKILKAGAILEEEAETEVIFANEKVQFQDEIDVLKEENEYLTRQKLDADGHMAELQSEVAVLRTQNENLSADKKRNVEELINAKNEVQALSQRKLEVEHNLRTSQFRENEAIVFLRQFRRFYRNVLKDKAAHGAGSISAITAEVTHKVPNAPDLGQLRDIDRMLVESGLLEETELDNDKASGSYLPSKDALLRSAGAAQRAAVVEAELPRDETDDDDDDSNDPYVAQTITRVAGPLRLPGPGVQMTMSMAELNNSTVEVDDSEDDTDEAGADAGAGTQPLDDRSYDTNSLASLAHSIARVPATGVLVTRKQRLLKTPAGLLTAMRETDLEKELLEMSERCIDLQMGLNEEKAVVDALTNKSGGLSKKRLAQEAISLRQQVEKKTASLTAIAWKMNELNLINKTYNEKMANREQHVLYLEEQLVELQNNNRRLIVDGGESEKKLRDEIDNLHHVVGGMTVPLWQFGEKSVRDKPLATRIVITSTGGDRVDETDPTPQRRRSLGQKEPDMEFPDFPDTPVDKSSDDENSMDEDRSMDGSMADPPRRPKRKTSDRLRRSTKLRALESSQSDSVDRKEQEKKPERIFETIATQTEEVQVLDMDEEIPVASRSVEMSVPDVAVEKFDADTQTEEAEEAVKVDMEAQTDEVQIFDLDVPVVVDQGSPENHDADVQTDDVQVYNIDAHMILDPETEMFDVEAQTEEIEIYDAGIQTDEEPMKEVNEKDVQTDDVEFALHVDNDDACVQTDEPEVDNVHVQTDEPEVDNVYVQTDDVEMDKAESFEIGTMTDIEEEEPRLSTSRALGATAGGAAVGAASSAYLLSDRKNAINDDNEVSLGHDEYSEPSDEDESEDEDYHDAEGDQVSLGLSDHSEPTEESGHESEEYDQFHTENEVHEPGLYFEDVTEKDKHDDDEELLEGVEEYDDSLEDKEAGEDSLREEHDDEEEEPAEKAYTGIVARSGHAMIPEDPREDDNDDGDEEDSSEEDEEADMAGTNIVTAKSGHAIFPEDRLEDDDDDDKNHDNEEYSSEEYSSEEEEEVDKADTNLAAARSDDAMRPEEPLEEDDDDNHDDEEHSSEEGSSEEGEDEDEMPQASPAIGRSGQQREETPLITTPSLSRDLSPDDRLMPKVASSRFMPTEDGQGNASRSPLASSRFMPKEDVQGNASRSSRRFTLERLASSRRSTIPQPQTTSSSFQDEGLGYDDLGQRWGMTNDEIAADAAVLITPRRPSQTLVISEDDIEDITKEESEIEESERKEIPLSPNSEDGQERDLFDYDFHERRSSHGPGGITGHAQALVEQLDYESDEDEQPEDIVSKSSKESIQDDDFEKMMDETAKALAAAEALMGDDDDDDVDGGTFANDDDYRKEENDYEAEMSENNDDYQSEEKDSDDESEPEFRSAQDHRFTANEDQREGEHDDSAEPMSTQNRPDPSMFVGGKAQDYEVRRFVSKLGSSIKPAVVNKNGRKYQVVDDEESSISVTSGMNREVPEKSPTRASARQAPHHQEEPPLSITSSQASSLKRDPSSRRRHEEKKKKSHRGDGQEGERRDRRHGEENDDGEDGGGGEERRHKHRSGHRSSRRTTSDADEGAGTSRPKSSRHRHRSSRASGEGEDGGERRHRSSRASGEGEDGGERRHRSSRNSGEGEDDGGERKHRSSRRSHRSSNDDGGEEKDRRGDEERRRHKKSSGEHRSSRKRSSAREE